MVSIAGLKAFPKLYIKARLVSGRCASHFKDPSTRLYSKLTLATNNESCQFGSRGYEGFFHLLHKKLFIFSVFSGRGYRPLTLIQIALVNNIGGIFQLLF